LNSGLEGNHAIEVERTGGSIRRIWISKCGESVGPGKADGGIVCPQGAYIQSHSKAHTVQLQVILTGLRVFDKHLAGENNLPGILLLASLLKKDIILFKIPNGTFLNDLNQGFLFKTFKKFGFIQQLQFQQLKFLLARTNKYNQVN